jgi:hypothetical protein
MTDMHSTTDAGEASMPIDVRILHNGRGILYLCHGTVNGKDFIDANSKVLAFNDRLKQVRYGLVDETTLDYMQISASEILTITAQNKKMAAFVPRGAVVAVIANDDSALGLARMWEAFIEHTGWETMTFRMRWKAESWIIEKVKANFGFDLIFDNGIAVG